MHLTNHGFLFTVGAVLAFAVHVDLAVVDLGAVGWVFMVVAVVSTALEVAVRRGRQRAVRADSEVRVPARVLTARVQPSVAPRETREFRAVPRPAGES